MKVDGQPLDLDTAEQDFAVMMAAPEKSEQDKFNLAPKPEVTDSPAPKKTTRRRTASGKAETAPKAVKKTSAPKTAPSADVTQRRAEKAASMMSQLGMMTEMYYTASGNDAFHKDTELFSASAAPFGAVMAEAAAHDKYIAAYLDNDGTGAIGAHVALIYVSGQIVRGVIENHNAETKVQLVVRIVIDKVKKFFRRGRK